MSDNLSQWWGSISRNEFNETSKEKYKMFLLPSDLKHRSKQTAWHTVTLTKKYPLGNQKFNKKWKSIKNKY